MEFLDEYIELCKIFGGLTDLIQGPGGNFSIKNDKTLLIKKSGALISNINENSNWLLCDISKIKDCINNLNDDASHTVIKGDGKPSIEVFFHCIPSKIVLHFHPTPLMSLLCSDEIKNYKNIGKYSCDVIEYIKPGVKLAKKICGSPLYDIYFLRNHGLIIHGNSKEEIIEKLNMVKDNLFNKIYNINNYDNVISIFATIKKITSKNYVIKSYFDNVNHISDFRAYTPDIAVFLQRRPLIINNNIEDQIRKYYKDEGIIPSIIISNKVYYVIGTTCESCTSINEIFRMYCEMEINGNRMNILKEDEINELINWDKEKARKNAT